MAGAAAALLFFSEYYFGNEGPVADLIESQSMAALGLHLAEIYGFYVFFTLTLVAALSWARNGALPVLFLSGCLFGWSTEGTVIAIVYENVPSSFIWPSVGWHATVNAALGLWLIPAALAARRWWVAPFTLAATGALWAWWTSWRWIDGIVPVADFQTQVLHATPLFVLGTALLAYFRGGLFTLPPSLGLVVAVPTLGLAVITGAAVPLYLAGFAGLIGVTLWALHRARLRDAPLPEFAAPRSPWRLLWLPLMPVCAIFTYEAMIATGTGLDAGLWVLGLFWTGLACFCLSLWRCFSGAVRVAA